MRKLQAEEDEVSRTEACVLQLHAPESALRIFRRPELVYPWKFEGIRRRLKQRFDSHPAFNLVSNRAGSETQGDRSDHSVTPFVDAEEASTVGDGTFPPLDCLEEVPLLYRRHCHRQPLWIFDEGELAILHQQSEDLVLSTLILTTQFSANPYFERRRAKMSQQFRDAARKRVMLTIANAAVSLSTLQSLCLLSWASFITRDMALASLYLNLGRDLLSSAGLDLRGTEPGPQARRANQAGKRLFWSFYILEQLYGFDNQRTISMKGGLENLRYCLSVGDSARRPLALEPPLLPDEAPLPQSDDNNSDTKDLGIWNYTVYLTAFWKEARNYILLSASDTERAPWAPDSYYTLIVSYMHELETEFPKPHRWDSRRFFQWSPEALERERSYWGPWLLFQFTYDAMFIIINHPFLLSSRSQSSNLKMPNTFWRASSESVLLHSTWVARLLTMAHEKAFDIFDPFLGYVAGVAASALLFYCRSQNDEIRRSAHDHFETCRAFVDQQAQVWPWCAKIKQELDLLVQHAFGGRDRDSPWEPSQTIRIDTNAMLELLDYTRHSTAAASNEPSSDLRKSLFDSSLLPHDSTADNQVATIEISEEVSEAAGHPVAPPILRPTISAAKIANPATKSVPSNVNDYGTEFQRSRNQEHYHPVTFGSLPTPSDEPGSTTTATNIEASRDTEVFCLPADNFSNGMLQDIFSQDIQWWNMSG
ncbi:hypothetical protein ABEF91_000112 [Exophiala dermatitidis]